MTHSNSAKVKLRFKRLPGNTRDMGDDALPLPQYELPESAGMDLRAAIPVRTTVVVAPGERKLIPTGFVIVVPPGYEGQIRPRSGLAFKNGITVLNTPGTIDASFTGETMILLLNTGQEPFSITRGMRVAQMVIAPVIQAEPVEVDEVEDTARGSGGFGSTGLR